MSISCKFCNGTRLHNVLQGNMSSWLWNRIEFQRQSADYIIASFPGFTRALVLRPIRKCTSLSVHFLIGLSTSARVKPRNEANYIIEPTVGIQWVLILIGLTCMGIYLLLYPNSIVSSPGVNSYAVCGFSIESWAPTEETVTS